MPWIVEQLLGLPRSTVGLMYCVALQLGTLCAEQPALAPAYTASFCNLLLAGARDAELEGLATHAGSALLGEGERQLLESPLDPELDSLYACTAMGPRVAALCYIRRLALKATPRGPSLDDSSATAARSSGHAIWRELLRLSAGLSETQQPHSLHNSVHSMLLCILATLPLVAPQLINGALPCNCRPALFDRPGAVYNSVPRGRQRAPAEGAAVASTVLLKLIRLQQGGGKGGAQRSPLSVRLEIRLAALG